MNKSYWYWCLVEPWLFVLSYKLPDSEKESRHPPCLKVVKIPPYLHHEFPLRYSRCLPTNGLGILHDTQNAPPPCYWTSPTVLKKPLHLHHDITLSCSRSLFTVLYIPCGTQDVSQPTVWKPPQYSKKSHRRMNCASPTAVKYAPSLPTVLKGIFDVLTCMFLLFCYTLSNYSFSWSFKTKASPGEKNEIKSESSLRNKAEGVFTPNLRKSLKYRRLNNCWLL